jgi:hypothetical protein
MGTGNAAPVEGTSNNFHFLMYNYTTHWRTEGLCCEMSFNRGAFPGLSR